MFQKFKIYYDNIRGIKSKISSLEEIVEMINPTIICLTETNLRQEDEIKIEGYKIYRNDREKEGGGVLIAIKNELEKMTIETERINNIEETLWIKIDNHKTVEK